MCGSEPVAGLTAGVDEVGRGTLAGPVVAAAVLLEPGQAFEGVTDSKQLSASRRQVLSALVRREVRGWAIGWCTVAEIDRLNILGASLLAMQRAVENLQHVPERVLVDGNQAPDFGPGLALNTHCVVGGDATEVSIGAASIVAKVCRDRWMEVLHEVYPDYGFARHKGYATAAHRDALQRHGACPEHRRTFRPVAACLRGTVA